MARTKTTDYAEAQKSIQVCAKCDRDIGEHEHINWKQVRSWGSYTVESWCDECRKKSRCRSWWIKGKGE